MKFRIKAIRVDRAITRNSHREAAMAAFAGDMYTRAYNTFGVKRHAARVNSTRLRLRSMQWRVPRRCSATTTTRTVEAWQAFRAILSSAPDEVRK